MALGMAGTESIDLQSWSCSPGVAFMIGEISYA